MRKGIQIKTIRNLNLDHPGGKMRKMSKQFWIKSVRNLYLDHPGGNAKS